MNAEDETARRAIAGLDRDEKSIGTLLDIHDPRAWLALDLGVRAIGLSWYDRLPSDSRILHAATRGEWALGVALCHPDGRIREAALRSVTVSPALLPLMAVRCADWAAPVRERARGLLRAALPGLSPETLTILTAVALRVAGRSHGGPVRDLVEEALLRAPDETIEALLTSGDRATRRLGLGIALDRGLFSALRLARTAAKDSDVVIQDLCASAAIAALPGAGDGESEIIGLLLGSRQPRVRSAGVTALNRLDRPGEAAPFLADRSTLVRACARWVLRRHGTDPLPLYRAMCADVPERHPAAAAGLGECGTRADAAVLWPLINHPSPPVRAHAVAGLRTLDVVATDRITGLIDDPSPAVVREVTRALLPSADRLPQEWLQERRAAWQPRHVRVAADRLLRARERMLPHPSSPSGV
ncbi:hypothetical protein [Streptomyces sp. NPDC002994]|uniref:hypothetical protein n=1 Tax=Streptomyces sp. NPDC002994 TaxID=3154441 RepID=UPI0033A491E3